MTEYVSGSDRIAVTARCIAAKAKANVSIALDDLGKGLRRLDLIKPADFEAGPAAGFPQ